MEIVPAVHDGFWIKDEKGTVVVWCADRERAEMRLKELNDK